MIQKNWKIDYSHTDRLYTKLIESKFKLTVISIELVTHEAHTNVTTDECNMYRFCLPLVYFGCCRMHTFMKNFISLNLISVHRNSVAAHQQNSPQRFSVLLMTD